MYDHLNEFSFNDRCAMTNDVRKWIVTIVNENAGGRLKVCKHDHQYLKRISFMLADIYDDTEYMGRRNV